MSDLRDLKAIERRKQVRKYIRQRLTQVEMAEKLQVDVTTISDDVAVIRRENIYNILSNKELIEKDTKSILESINQLNEIDAECWKIYYGGFIIKKKDEKGNPIDVEIPLDPKTKLDALSHIEANLKRRCELLKLISPQQITIEKMVYVEKMIPIVMQKYTEIVLEYVPKEKQVELLDKLMTIDIEGMTLDGK